MLCICTPIYDALNNIMADRNNEIAQLLEKNLQGALTPAEQETLNAWIDASPANRAVFDNVDSPEAVLRELRLYEEARHIAMNVRKRVEQTLARSKATLQPVPAAKAVSYRYWWYAAAAVLIIGVSTWLLLQSPPADPTSTYPKGYAPESLVTFTTSKGEYRTFNLPDSSRVFLNVDSRVQWPKIFPRTERRVELEGGALFNIKPAYNNGAKIPFIVVIKEGNAAVGQVEVMGTQFNIEAYRNGQYYKATVLEGQIKLSNSADSKLVSANQMAHWTKNGPITVVAENEPEADALWTDSTLKYSNTPVQYIYQHLERVFDITVEYKNNIKPGRTFSGELHTPSGIRAVLNVINDQCDLSAVYDSSQKKVIVQ
jgi:ferric-dicitrate binding protein FerR (iron transport regulator)